MAEVATAYAWALAGLFGLALVHKGRVLTQGDVSAEPLLAVRPLSVRPTLAFASAAVGEVAIIAGLLLVPMWGLVGAALAAGLYALLLRRVDAGVPCRCFGAGGGLSARTAVGRNLAIVAVAALGAAVLAVDETPVAYPYAASVTAVFFAAAAASVALRRLEGRTFQRGETWRS